MWYERVGNLHVHTTWSDGTADPRGVGELAHRAGLDFVVLNDHNAYPIEAEGWYGRTLLLVGQEVHDPARPDANHLLVLGLDSPSLMAGAADGEVASLSDLAARPQALIDAVRAGGGACFLAHPYEHAGAYTREPEINWVSWEIEGFTGLELWNYMSEFKAHVRSLPIALLYAFFPKLAIRGPFPETLARWDHLCGSGHVVAIGGSDAHATAYALGPLKRRVFPYEHLFRALNTHVLLPGQWSGRVEHDRAAVYEALARGRSFIAYDGLASACGFSFTASDGDSTHVMGDEVLTSGPLRFHAHAPRRARLRLIHNGFPVAEVVGRELVHESRAPGCYRIEAHRTFLGQRRGWIYSNPIFVRTERRSEVDCG